MLMLNFGGTNKEYYGIFDSGLLCIYGFTVMEGSLRKEVVGKKGG